MNHKPVTVYEVEQFIREWFGKLDIHPPVEEMLRFLADEKLVMKMPDRKKPLCHHEGFKEWYKGIEKFVDQAHTIRGSQITPAKNTAKVEIVVQWQASDLSATGADSGRKGHYAAQT